MKKVLFFLLLNLFATFVQGQKVVALSSIQLKQIQADKSFQQALQTLEETGANVDYSQLALYLYQTNPQIYP